ncbi:MAG: rod shape-determining protein MreC [Selenomonas ruminantium]|jgi:rod shape-determining protein MreC|uniref:Cell shape-determining protein MreC n=1 Tax=Selenomonas ruminantium TaxID=971 RepID=A0A927ZTW5_SELRU|nr:rod shape-determining protein MreC [Selenomonas ruminantium]
MSNHVRKDKEDGRKGWAMAFVVVSLFCIIFFAARGRFQAPVSSQAVSLVLSPFQQATAWVANEIHYATSAVWEVATLYEQNKMLRNEVEQLRGINLQANEALAENERLRKMIGYQQAARQFDLVAARVIGRESDTWSRMIVIDRGTMNGIANDMPVVTPQGLVGRVVEAGLNSSKVQLILDPRSSVGTIVQRAESRVTGIVQGDMDNPTMPQMVNIPKNADVVEGDVIVTSGFGGVYPKGIIVGLVSSLKNDDGGLLKIGVLEAAVDFQKLEDVMVITASREAPPEPIKPPTQTPGTETDPVTGEKIDGQKAEGQK